MTTTAKAPKAKARKTDARKKAEADLLQELQADFSVDITSLQGDISCAEDCDSLADFVTNLEEAVSNAQDVLSLLEEALSDAQDRIDELEADNEEEE